MATRRDAELEDLIVALHKPAGDSIMELDFVSTVDALNEIKQTCSPTRHNTELMLYAQV